MCVFVVFYSAHLRINSVVLVVVVIVVVGLIKIYYVSIIARVLLADARTEQTY